MDMYAIPTYIWLKFVVNVMLNVGKYASPMDPMGMPPCSTTSPPGSLQPTQRTLAFVVDQPIGLKDVLPIWDTLAYTSKLLQIPPEKMF